MDWFLYDNGLRHETVKLVFKLVNYFWKAVLPILYDYIFKLLLR